MTRVEELEQENADLRKQIESLNERLARLRATDPLNAILGRDVTASRLVAKA